MLLVLATRGNYSILCNEIISVRFTYRHFPLVILPRTFTASGLELGASGVPCSVSSLKVDLDALGVEVGHRGKANDQVKLHPPTQHHVLGGGEGISVAGHLVVMLQQIHIGDGYLIVLACEKYCKC